MQWNIADYLFQNREIIRVGLRALRSALGGSKTGSKTRQTSETTFEKSVRSSKLPVFDLLWMLMFTYIIHVYTCTIITHYNTIAYTVHVYSIKKLYNVHV